MALTPDPRITGLTAKPTNNATSEIRLNICSMIGGKNSFGAGGYYRTPIEDVLPVKMKAPDKEERFATALCFVLDRSGSMHGQKVEICKSASIATVELLSPKDFVGLVAFDSLPHWVVPMTSAAGKAAIAAQISTINADGGTNIYPAMVAAREALAGTRAKVKHMIRPRRCWATSRRVARPRPRCRWSPTRATHCWRIGNSDWAK